LIEQHRALKKENHELKETIEKIKISKDSELNIEKEQHRKTLLEVAKVNRENKTLKGEIDSLKTKLLLKDKEIDDLKTRLEKKETLDNKLKERDLNIFQKNFGKNAVENGYDNKVLSVVKVYENQKTKLEEENKTLRTELENLRGRVKEQESEKVTLKRDYSQVSEKVTKDFLNKVTELENENANLDKENETLRSYIEKLNNEVNTLKEESREIRKKYDDLRLRYSALEGVTPDKNTSRPELESDTVRFNKSGSNSKRHFQESKMTTPLMEENFSSFKPFAELHELNLVECRRILNEVRHL